MRICNKRYTVSSLCRIRSGSSSGKGGGRLPPSLSLPPASDDVLWDCDCWDRAWIGCDWCVCWLWLCCFLSLLWWASSPFWEGTDSSWVFFTLKNTGEGGLFSMGLNSQSMRTILISQQYNYNKRVMWIWSALTFSLCWIWLGSFETLSPHLWAPHWPCLGGSTVCASADAPLLQTLPRSTGSCDSASHQLWPDVNTDMRN